MEIVFRMALTIAGIINIIPSILAFAPSKFLSSYGIELPDATFELLLRHRAVFFGIVGGLLIFSAITKKHYELSTSIGLVSMVSFVVIYLLIGGGITDELKKVVRIDIVAMVILLVGFALYKFK